MKGIYKAFLFMLIFQMMALTLSILGVFGEYGLYSDIDFTELDENSGMWEWISAFFGAEYGDFDTGLIIFGITGVVIAAGSVGLVLHGNVAPLMMGVLVAMSVFMIGTSKTFFGTILEKGGVAVVALGLCLFVAVAALILFAVIEYPVGGDSG